MEGFIVVFAFVALFVLGFPVVLAIGIPCIVYILSKGLPVDLIAQRTLYALDDLEKNSVDYYAALRSAYTQQRADLIRQKRERTDAKGELDRRDNLALVR